MKLSSALPEGVDNGLPAIAFAMRNHPEDQHIVVASIDCCRLTTNVDTGEVETTARICWIEPIADWLEDRVRAAADESRAGRTGQRTLPQVDPETGEILEDPR